VSVVAIILAGIVGIFAFAFITKYSLRVAKRHGNGLAIEAAIYGTYFALILWFTSVAQYAYTHGSVSGAWLFRSALWLPIFASIMGAVQYFTIRKKRRDTQQDTNEA